MEKAILDASSSPDWYFLLKNTVLGYGAKPNVLLIGITDLHVPDQIPVDSGRLAQVLTRSEDLPLLFEKLFLTLDQRADFLLSKASFLFAMRKRIRDRTLAAIVPGFRKNVNELNRTAYLKGQKSIRAQDYFFFEQLVKEASQSVPCTVFVPIPLPHPYSIPEKVRKIIQSHGGHLIKTETDVSYSLEQFEDGYHMNKGSSAAFTRRILPQLQKILSEGCNA
ncbi:MAG: hypothetical protein R3B54_03730 [Bdellovibrionota bacterium]